MTVPVSIAVPKPADVIVSALGSLIVHVTAPVNVALVLSLKMPVAVK